MYRSKTLARDIGYRSLLNLQDGNNVGVPLYQRSCFTMYFEIPYNFCHVSANIYGAFTLSVENRSRDKAFSLSFLPSLFFFQHNGALQPSNLRFKTSFPRSLLREFIDFLTDIRSIYIYMLCSRAGKKFKPLIWPFIKRLVVSSK